MMSLENTTEESVLSQSLFQWTVFCNINCWYKNFIQSRHNPCFSGQCFAIIILNKLIIYCYIVTILVLVDSVLQFFEIEFMPDEYRKSQSLFQWTVFCNLSPHILESTGGKSHNPCFSGQCFAINRNKKDYKKLLVTILVLVDSVLQFEIKLEQKTYSQSQSLFQWTVFCNA